MNRQTETTQLSPLKRAYMALETLQKKLDAYERKQSSPIAVIGMSCRFPGADGIESYWKLLRDGVHAVGQIPPDRWKVDAFYDPDPKALGKMMTRHGGFLSDVAGFDAPFFAISPREALYIDPQQRLLLETAWEALQDAGIVRERLSPQSTGVFIGITSTDYSQRSFHEGGYAEIDSYHITGNTLNAAAGRLSYCFGFRGPCIAVDTACSSSLSAMHQAVRSLQYGECETALVGGVNLMLSPLTYIALSKTNVLSPTGVCRSFDAAADGMVRGEGCGVVVLKPLEAAQRDDDRILAVIRGSAVNQDGPSSGLTVPNGPAQEQLIQTALKHAGLNPAEVSYVEAHGTGTSLGDPIELRALASSYAARRSHDEPLWIGSVKTNIGHLEAGAGMAGFIKLVLMLQHRQIPPHLHFYTPTPHFDWNRHPIHVVDQLMPWSAPTPLRAGLSSFGFSGVNAHVLLEEAPQTTTKTTSPERPLDVLTLSAHTETALRESAARCARFLNTTAADQWKNACFSINHGRGTFEHRLALQAASGTEAAHALEAWLHPSKETTCIYRRCEDEPKIAFLFTGQGAQYPNMARELYETHNGFHQTLNQCAELILRHAGFSLLDVLYGSTEQTRLIHRTDHTQPALFALEYALASLWRSWGVQPSVVMGHSVGEYAAACIAGVFSLDEGIALISERARLIHSTPGKGAMLAVSCDPDPARRAIPAYPDVSIAAVNSPEQTVLSGNEDSIQALQSILEKQGLHTQRLNTSHAFHSSLLDEVIEPFRRFAASIHFSTPNMPLISNLTTQIEDTALTSPDYWARHLREPVFFSQSIKGLSALEVDVVLEIGPKPVLLPLAQSGWEGPDILWLPSLKPPQTDWRQMLETLAQLYAAGTKINWREFEKPYARTRMTVPAYPFQHERFWQESTAPQDQTSVRRQHPKTQSQTPLLGEPIPLPGTDQIRFESCITFQRFPFLRDHRIHDIPVLPAAVYIELLLEAAQKIHAAQGVLIQQLTFQAPCLLSEQEDLQLQTLLEPSYEHQYRFRIFSRHGEHTPAWQEHVSGHLRIQNTPPKAPKPSAAVSASKKVDAVQQHYKACKKRGVDFGPAFQAIQNLEWDGKRAYASIQLPPTAQNHEPFSLHPVILDACFQTLGAFYLDRNETPLYLPVSIDRIQAVSGPHTAAAAVVLRQTATDEQMLCFDFTLQTPEGASIALIEGMRFIEAPPERFIIPPSTQSSPDFYRISWKEASETPTPHALAGSWLLVSSPNELTAALTTYITASGGTCKTTVPQTPEWEQSIPTTDHVLILPPPHSQASSPIEPETVSSEIDRHVQTLLQALPAVLKHQLPCWIITQNAQPVLPNDRLDGLAQSPLWGIGKSLIQECPELPIRLIDLDHTNLQPCAKQLWNEMHTPSTENQIAFRHEKRYVPRMIQNHQLPQTPSTCSFQPDAVYLISGGTGGLGLCTAEWMAQAGAQEFILLSRTGTVDESLTLRLQSLKSLCRQVHIEACDIADQNQVESLFRKWDDQGKTLRGIIHCAGTLDDAPIQDLTPERFQHVFRPKINGALNLVQAAKTSPIDHFILYSSLSSVWGAVGQSNYVAANAFLDALAWHLRAQGVPALSINWGPWDQVGMAAHRNLLSSLHEQGIVPIPVHPACEAVGRLLTADETQCSVAKIDWTRLLQRFGGSAPRFLQEIYPEVYPASFSPAAHPKPNHPPEPDIQLANANPEERLNRLEHLLIRSIRNVLRMNSGTFDKTTALNRLGIDSLMAVELRNQMRNRLGIDVPIALFLDGSSTALLTRKIQTLWEEKQKESTTENRNAMPIINPEELNPQDAQHLLNHLDELSDEEVEALFNQATTDLKEDQTDG